MEITPKKIGIYIISYECAVTLMRQVQVQSPGSFFDPIDQLLATCRAVASTVLRHVSTKK
jgi:hypothetical protein